MTSPMAWHTLSGFRRDRSVARRKLAPGTVRRIARFAAPYKRWLGMFLVLILFDAVITVLNPLILKQIIDKGVAPGAPKGDPALVVRLALLVAALAVVDAGINLVQRWYSARIGEGLIYDMRSKVYDHVQRMPIAFFTRTQTGALISRLNNDVLGAQQAFTGTLSSVVSNLLTVSLVIAAMLTLSWQITLVSLVLLPVFLLPARLLGARLQQVTRESYGLDAQMNATMSERFNVAGALLVKLYGRPEREAAAFRDKAGRVRDIGVISAMYSRIFFVALSLVAALATAITYGMGGVMAAQRTLEIGTLVALTAYLARLYGPLTALSNVRVDVMTALVSFERVFEVLDLPPAIADKPGAVELPRTAATIEFDEVDFRYPVRRGGLAGLPGIGGRPRQEDSPAGAARGELLGAARRARGAGGPVRGREDDDLPARDPHVRRAGGLGAGRRARRPRRHAAVAARRCRRRHPGPAHVPRDHRREPAPRPGRGHRRAAVGGPGRGPGR